MYKGYLAIGGKDGVGTTELLNAGRTYQYVQNILPSFSLSLTDDYVAPDLPTLLKAAPYRTPVLDEMSWVDTDDPATADFLGLYPLAVTGVEDSTWSSDEVELVTDGGVLSGGRNAGREIRVSGMMIASSEAGLNAGYTWLRNVLQGSDCDDEDCDDRRLIMLSSAPDVCDEMLDDAGLSEGVHPCLAPYVRQFYRVGCPEGFTVKKEFWSHCGPMAEVEFLLYAGVPQPHRLPEFVGISQGEAVESFTNIIPNPNFGGTGNTFFNTRTQAMVYGGNNPSTNERSLIIEPRGFKPDDRVNLSVNSTFREGDSKWSLPAGSEILSGGWSGNPFLRLHPLSGGSFQGFSGTLAPTQNGDVFVSFYVRFNSPSPIDEMAITLYLSQHGSGGGEVVRHVTVPIGSPTGWNRVSVPVTNNIGVVDEIILSFIPISNTVQVDFGPSDWMDFSSLLVEQAETSGSYFDYSMADTDSVSYRMGTNRESIAEFSYRPESYDTYGYLSFGDLAINGDLPLGERYHVQADVTIPSLVGISGVNARKIQAVFPTRSGEDFVIESDQAPSTPGTYSLELDFTVPFSSAGQGELRLYNGGDTNVYWDHVLMSIREPGQYFDGDTPDAGGWFYSWTGTQYASASVAEYNPLPPVSVTNVNCTVQYGASVARRNRNSNPGPTLRSGWDPIASLGSFSRTFDAPFTHTPGGKSAMVYLETVTTTLVVGALKNVGASPNGKPALVDPGMTYTQSIWHRANRILKTILYVDIFDAGGGLLATNSNTYASFTHWERASVTFTAPRGAHHVETRVVSLVGSTADDPPDLGDWAAYCEALLERSGTAGTYFDGSTPDTSTVSYSWGGIPGQSYSSASVDTADNPFVDPDCDPIPAPPKPPVILPSCIETPAEWTRYSVLVDKSFVPRWGSAAPVITMSSGATAARQVRVRLYPIVNPLDPFSYDECGFESEFILTYLPPSSTMTIDAVLRSAMVQVGDSDPVSALHLLTGSDGRPYTWGVLTCDRDYIMTVDVAPVANDVSVSLSVVGRD